MRTSSSSQTGSSLLELVFVASLVATSCAVSVPAVLAALEESRSRGAVRYVVSRLQQTRMEAVTRTADVAIRFSQDARSYLFTTFVDGNADGVRTADIQSGVDRPIGHDERLVDQFPGIEFGALPGLPPVDPSGTPPGNDPVRFGPSDIVTFTALGTSTPGSLYILARGGTQFVIRVFGETGKTRVLRFDPASGQWVSL
jgi:hypothetical protein